MLEAKGIDLGIVRTIVANRTLELTITGRANHAGTTPMDMRADAFEATARVSLAAIEEARPAGDGTVATMGQISVLPGSSNIVPGRVVFTLDIRSPRETLVERVQRKALSVLERLCAENCGLQSSFRMLLNSPAVELDPHVLDALGKSADACGFSRRDMVSGAGHDAMVMARMVPTGMLFAPSRGGRSHCPEEWTDFEQLQKGTETLLGALISLADE
ncbi:MAG: M20/M25/M40 family metallo-hydrolase [Oscillospiraceae bacterium]|nr:M20/M25/M40 family metallo-hydrolase [Oscillospiraceae bacterium]